MVFNTFIVEKIGQEESEIMEVIYFLILLKNVVEMILVNIILNGLKLEVVTIGENGVTQEDLLVHDAKCEDNTLHQMLVKLQYPLATGIIRSFEEDTFEEREQMLTEEVQRTSKFSKVDDLFFSGETYEVT